MIKREKSREFSQKLLNSLIINRFVDISQYDKFHRASILQSEYNTKKELYLQDNKNLNTMEQKLNILLGGYGKRLNQIQHSVEEVFFEFDQKAIEKQVFQQLSSQVGFFYR